MHTASTDISQTHRHIHEQDINTNHITLLRDQTPHERKYDKYEAGLDVRPPVAVSLIVLVPSY